MVGHRPAPRNTATTSTCPSARHRRPSSTDPLGLSSVLVSLHAVPEVAILSSPPQPHPRLAQSKPPDQRPPWPLPARYSPCRPPASARAPRRSSPPSRRPRRASASRSPLRAGAEEPVTEVVPVLLAPVLFLSLSSALSFRCRSRSMRVPVLETCFSEGSL